MTSNLAVFLCPECKGTGGSFDNDCDYAREGGDAPWYKCGLCDGMRFVAVNVEHLKQI